MEMLEFFLEVFCFLVLLVHIGFVRDMLVYGRVYLGERHKSRQRVNVITLLFFLCFGLGKWLSLFSFRANAQFMLLMALGMVIWDMMLTFYRFAKYRPVLFDYRFYPKVYPVSKDSDEIVGEVCIEVCWGGETKHVVAKIKNSPEVHKALYKNSYVQVSFKGDSFDMQPLAKMNEVILI